MATSGKPPGGGRAGGDETSIEMDDLLDELFEEAPKTDPSVPALAEDVALQSAQPSTARAVDESAHGASDDSAEPPTAFAPPLPEMYPEIWQAGIQALVSVPDASPPPTTATADWMAEAQLFKAEAALAETPTRAALCLLAGARAAESAGDLAGAADLYDEALERAPRAPDALRGRARLAESVGDLDEAHALWARLAVAAETPEERAFYAGLSAEWTLARRGALPAVALDAMAPGPSRTLALFEESLRGGNAAKIAAALAVAGRAVGGVPGAVMLEEAARFAALALDTSATSAYQAAARQLDPAADGGILGRLRDAARMDIRGAAKTLAPVLSSLPADSALARAIGRWAAGLARRRGDPAEAGALLATLGPATAAAARDRIDFELASGAPLDRASLERLRAGATSGVAIANLDWIEAGDLIRRGETAAAGTLLARGIEAQPDATPLGLLAEQLALTWGQHPDPAGGLEPLAGALEGWLRSDPARRAEAALALAEARERGGAGNSLGVRAALQTAVEAAPESALFWTVAAADARAGRRADAAAVLDYGAEVWSASTLPAGLRACAEAKIGLEDPARALGPLGSEAGLSAAGRALGAVAVARLAERAGDAGLLRAALAAAPGDDPAQRAELALRRASSYPAADGKPKMRALAEALAAVPDHPLALPLYVLQAGVDSSAAAAALAAAGAAGEPPSPTGRLFALAAGGVLALDDDGETAFLRASELVTAWPADRQAQLALVRAAARLPASARRRALAELPLETSAPGAPDAAMQLLVGQARLEVGDSERAAEALGGLAGGRFEAEARRAAVHLGTATEGLPPRLRFGPGDESAHTGRATLVRLTEQARASAWPELIATIEGQPPHEGRAGAATLAFLAAVADGHDLTDEAARLAAASVEAARSDQAAGRVGLPELARIAESEGATPDRLRAYELAVERLGVAESERRAAALAQAGRAQLLEAGPDAQPATDAWQAALAADPTYLPAALALRRGAARRGDAAAAAAASEVEAGCLLVPAHRVRALLLSAALISENGSAGSGGPGDPADGAAADRRALEILRAALATDPTHEAAFERLREVLTRLGDAPALAVALAARIEVAQNPFEVTSLRLARADLLAGPLADPSGARAELETILRKQPEHPRALANLSELLWAARAWAETGEIYLRRAVVERDPGTLREIFLRLGQIYSEHVPDAKRAATAYERVLSVDPDNYQALRALSDLYVAEGETKLALPVTDRLVAREPDLARRTAFRVRLGEILMQAGDQRRAGLELRRAVEEAPRDLAAVSALAHFLERARDPAGRRSVLDRAVGLLRHDLEGSQPQGVALGTLRALASLLTLRERPHAALAAAQLFAALDGQAAARASTSRPGRSLEALRRPELDERSFPPELLPGIRNIFRLLGPLLRPSGPELAQKLARHGVTRGDRKARGAPPRPAFEAVAGELGVGDFDLYVRTPAAVSGPIPLRAEPGNPPAIIVGAPLCEQGPAALRFVAARALRLTATHLDTLLALPVEEAGALLVAIIRQSVPDYRHAEVRDALVDVEAARLERLIPRKVKPQVLPFAVESAGTFDLAALYGAVRDGANATGLLAAADLPAALRVVLALSGSVTSPAAAESGLTLPAILASPEALTLLRFALSDRYDDLARALEDG
jgi:cellulose synthase operon protein C